MRINFRSLYKSQLTVNDMKLLLSYKNYRTALMLQQECKTSDEHSDRPIQKNVPIDYTDRLARSYSDVSVAGWPAVGGSLPTAYQQCLNDKYLL